MDKKIDLREILSGQISGMARDHAKEIFVIDCDCSSSTKTVLLKDLHNIKFVNVGIAEQNMIGIAAGLALSGKKVIANGFSNMICLRAFDFLYHLVARQKLNIVVVGHYSGLTSGEEGGSHHALITFGIMNMLKGFSIYIPYDEESTKKCVSLIFKIKTPLYVHLGKLSDEVVIENKSSLSIGDIVSCSNITDILLVCMGNTVKSTYESYCYLNEKYSVLTDLLIVTYLEENGVNFSNALDFKKYKKVYVVEDNYFQGGLYSLMCDVLNSYGVEINSIAIKEFTSSGTVEELYEQYGLTSDYIVGKVLKGNCSFG